MQYNVNITDGALEKKSSITLLHDSHRKLESIKTVRVRIANFTHSLNISTRRVCGKVPFLKKRRRL